MTSYSKLAASVVFASVALLKGAVPASAGDVAAAKVVGPLKAIALTVGAKRAVGYYTVNNGACSLTLAVADTYSETASASPSEPVRVNMSVLEGSSARMETFGGQALSFSCANGASTMMVQPVERLAYVAPVK